MIGLHKNQKLYWKCAINLQIKVLLYVRSICEDNLKLHVEVLYKLFSWYFIYDHYNYARWLTIRWLDLYTIEMNFSDVCNFLSKGNFSFQKSYQKFSRMDLDQIHEQNNELIIGCGGAIDLLNKAIARNVARNCSCYTWVLILEYQAPTLLLKDCLPRLIDWLDALLRTHLCKITSLNLTTKSCFSSACENCDWWFRNYRRKTIRNFCIWPLVMGKEPILQKNTLNKTEISNYTRQLLRCYQMIKRVSLARSRNVIIGSLTSFSELAFLVEFEVMKHVSNYDKIDFVFNQYFPNGWEFPQKQPKQEGTQQIFVFEIVQNSPEWSDYDFNIYKYITMFPTLLLRVRHIGCGSPMWSTRNRSTSSETRIELD